MLILLRQPKSWAKIERQEREDVQSSHSTHSTTHTSDRAPPLSRRKLEKPLPTTPDYEAMRRIRLAVSRKSQTLSSKTLTAPRESRGRFTTATSVTNSEPPIIKSYPAKTSRDF